MLGTLLTAVTVAVGFAQRADTTFSVERGVRLEVRNGDGDIRVSAWNRNEVRIHSSSSRQHLTIERSGSVVQVRPRRGRFDDDDVVADLEISVPAYLAVTLRGIESNLWVEGTQADVAAETVDGTVDIRGGRGRITAISVEQTVRIRGASGRVEASSNDGDIFIDNVTGDILAEAVDGDIDLRAIDSGNLVATTVDGNVSYEGTVRSDGRYRLSTHDGDVTMLLPNGANATVTAASYEGDFETDFPILLRDSRSRRFNFTIGDGSARIDLQSFDGDIYVRRSR